jgi:hypothetical protein
MFHIFKILGPGDVTPYTVFFCRMATRSGWLCAMLSNALGNVSGNVLIAIVFSLNTSIDKIS